jgi:hypothetical protein
MEFTQKPTHEPLENRIATGQITVAELRERSLQMWSLTEDSKPFKWAGEFGCPVCFSILSEDNKLVRKNNYVVCDYCVNFVEGYL